MLQLRQIVASTSAAGPVAAVGCQRLQQRAAVVLVCDDRQAFEHVAEVGFREVAVAAGEFHEGINDRGALRGGLTSHEEPSHISFRSDTIPFGFAD